MRATAFVPDDDARYRGEIINKDLALCNPANDIRVALKTDGPEAAAFWSEQAAA